jgi:non-homologous end joining protein Ku
VIKRKRKGEEIHAAAPVEEDEAAPDLLEALRASVESAQSRSKSKPKARNGRSTRKPSGRRQPRSRAKSR